MRSHSPPVSKRAYQARARVRGFTLIEIMVALLLIGIVLTVALQSTSAMLSNTYELRQRQYALWSAQNRLAELQIQRLWPPLGMRQTPCHQGAVLLVCEEEVTATPNAYFRRMEIRVYRAAASDQANAGNGHILASLVAYLDR